MLLSGPLLNFLSLKNVVVLWYLWYLFCQESVETQSSRVTFQNFNSAKPVLLVRSNLISYPRSLLPVCRIRVSKTWCVTQLKLKQIQFKSQ